MTQKIKISDGFKIPNAFLNEKLNCIENNE